MLRVLLVVAVASFLQHALAMLMLRLAAALPMHCTAFSLPGALFPSLMAAVQRGCCRLRPRGR